MRAYRGRALRPMVAVAATAVLLGACGTDAAGLATGATAGLHEKVGAVRASAAIGDPEAARAALDAFRGEVHRLVDAGELDAAEAVTLLAHADRIAGGLDAVPAMTPAPTPTPEPTPRAASRTTRKPERSEFSEALAALIRERMREHDRDERKPEHKHEKEDRHDGRH